MLNSIPSGILFHSTTGSVCSRAVSNTVSNNLKPLNTMKYTNQFSKIFTIKLLHQFLAIVILSFSLITFTGCGSDSSTSSVNNSPDNGGNEEPVDTQGPNDVWMNAGSFNVSNLNIEAGTTVTWTNTSDVNHTVTSGTRGDADAGELFDSGSIAPGGTFSFTFENAGSYAYFCAFHSGMDAEVTVTE